MSYVAVTIAGVFYFRVTRVSSNSTMNKHTRAYAGISCSGLASDLFVLHVEVTSDACKGDIIMQSIDVSCVEVLTKICFISKRKEVKIVDEGRRLVNVPVRSFFRACVRVCVCAFVRVCE